MSDGPEGSGEQLPSGEWDSDEQLDFLKMERQVNPTEQLTDEGLTKKLLSEAAPLAAQRIIHIATHGSNENTSLRAAQYVVDTLLAGDSGGAKSKIEELLGDVVSQAEIFANGGK